MTAKRSAHERFPEVIAAAVRVFARDGYRSAHMSDVAREAGLSEAALYRYVDGKEDLFVLAIRHALLLEPLPEEDDPDGAFPLTAPSLAEMICRGARVRGRRGPVRRRSRRRCVRARGRTTRRPSSSRSCASCSPWRSRPARPPT